MRRPKVRPAHQDTPRGLQLRTRVQPKVLLALVHVPDDSLGEPTVGRAPVLSRGSQGAQRELNLALGRDVMLGRFWTLLDVTGRPVVCASAVGDGSQLQRRFQVIARGCERAQQDARAPPEVIPRARATHGQRGVARGHTRARRRGVRVRGHPRVHLPILPNAQSPAAAHPKVAPREVQQPGRELVARLSRGFGVPRGSLPSRPPRVLVLVVLTRTAVPRRCVVAE